MPLSVGGCLERPAFLHFKCVNWDARCVQLFIFVTLNKDEQFICWLFQKHSLMIASWNQTFLRVKIGNISSNIKSNWCQRNTNCANLGRMRARNHCRPQQSKELFVSLKQTSKLVFRTKETFAFFRSIFPKKNWDLECKLLPFLDQYLQRHFDISWRSALQRPFWPQPFED